MVLQSELKTFLPFSIQLSRFFFLIFIDVLLSHVKAKIIYCQTVPMNFVPEKRKIVVYPHNNIHVDDCWYENETEK